MKFQSVNPCTEEIIAEYKAHTLEDCQIALRRAQRAFEKWRGLDVQPRTRPLGDAAVLLRGSRERYARMLTREMGKPIVQARAEIDKCASLFEFYARTAEDFLADEVIETDAVRSYVTFEPLGVILGIMPWNFPLWQVFRFAAPTLVAGNVCILKHAPNVPAAALEAERIMLEAGFPEHVFQTLLIDVETTTRLIESDAVAGVSLTGSVPAGISVGIAAARGLKQVVLELGGSDPFIVLADADLDRAVEAAVVSRTRNSGQSCIAAKRFIVVEEVADEFRARFVERLRRLKVGDPMREDTDVGPVARRVFLENLQRQLDDARERGANLIPGPDVPDGKGFFFRPTVVTDATPEMKVLSEEVFGPIAPVLVAADEEEAIRMANATEYGLGASIWSRNVGRAELLARRIRAGFVSINDMVRSDPRLPFGGIKKSGIGRELSHYALKQFVNVKTIVIGG